MTRTYKTEFPNFKLEEDGKPINLPEQFIDTSNSREISPCFLDPNYKIVLWIDYEHPEDRSQFSEGLERFGLILYRDEELNAERMYEQDETFEGIMNIYNRWVNMLELEEQERETN